MRAYTGARFYPVDDPVIDGGVMLVEDGKIAEIGRDVRVPEGVQAVDLTGRVVLPGLVDAHSHVGIWGDGEGAVSNDGNEGPGPITADVSALDAANPEQTSFASCREGGITTVQIPPGSGNPIGGLCFACKTAGTVIDEMVIRFPTGLKGALGENPKRSHGVGRKQAPYTRMGIAALIRSYFARAEQYMRQREDEEEEGPDTDLGLENVCRVLRGEIPFRIHAHRHDDIVTAIRLCEELGVSYSIEHCTDGHLIADFLGERRIWAHVGPGLSSRGKVETFHRNEANPARLVGAGVRVSLVTDHPFLDSRYFMAYAGIAHKYGLSFDDTLRAITKTPAESIGVADRVGSLSPGNDADFVILAGEPFSYRSPVLATYIEGREVYTRTPYGSEE
ncbi:MAG: amidohydrolase [Bacillota bacterium]